MARHLVMDEAAAGQSMGGSARHSDKGFSRRRTSGAARWLPLVVMALIGAIGTFIAFRIASDADATRVRAAIELRAEWRARDIDKKLGVLANPVEALAILLASQPTIDSELIHRFAARSHSPDDPIRRLIWAPRLARPEPKAAAEAPGAGAAAEAGGDSYFPVEVEQTFSELKPLGIANLAAEPARRAVIERARDEARPLSTVPLPLLNSALVGYSIFSPIYQNGAVPETVAERRRQLRGIVEGDFAIEAALNAAIAETPAIVERIYFYVGRQPGAAPPDATYLPAAGAVTVGGDMPAAPASGAIRLSRSFDVFGLKWVLVSDFDAAALASSSSVWAAPAGVLALTLLLLAYLAREQGYRVATENRVIERTADLRAANDALAAEIEARQKTYLQLAQAQKMEAVGNLTGGMAHDFNNLLGIIIGNLDLLRDRQTADREASELTEEALDAALRGADLTRRLLAFARRQPLQPERTDLNRLVAGISALLKRTLGEQIEITLQLGSEVWPVVVDPAQLESSLTNLATNARDAMPRGGQLIIVTSNRHLDEDYAAQHAEVEPGDYAMIEVSDTGAGIPPEVASRIFEPFYTTKEQGKGTGLGLAMVFGFMKQSGGHINVYSEIGIGTTFRLYLPRADVDAPAAAAVALSAPLPRGSGEVVLAVEDNASLRRVVVRQLSELGYRVVEAEDAASALRALESERVDLLFSDVVMPGGASGYDLAQAALARWPGIKVVLTSGFPDIKLNGNGRSPSMRLLSKPYRRDDLGHAIREVLDAPASG